jgi:hypothetical protein
MSKDTFKIKAIQSILGVEADGIWGPESQAALDALVSTESSSRKEIEHQTYASSFADPADVKAFDECKAKGGTDEECFAYGDNGIGCYGDSTKEGSGPSCALPPEYSEARWGTVANAKHKEVGVMHLDPPYRNVICLLKDRMPHLENLANEARIDLNPDACKALGLTPPMMEPVVWWWVA